MTLLSPSENCFWRYIKLIYIKLEAFSDRIVVCMHAQLIRHYEGLERIREIHTYNTILVYNMYNVENAHM